MVLLKFPRKTQFQEGRWYYRGELETGLVRHQASNFIDKSKFEGGKGEDSDGDSIYRRVVYGDRTDVSKEQKLKVTQNTAQ